MLLSRDQSHGFTFAELLVSAAIGTVAALGAYLVLNSSLTLYAKNFSINRSHQAARISLEKMALKINAAGAAPILVNEKGADVVGNGPACGIRLCTPVTTATYTITGEVASTAATATIQFGAGQPRPRVSDILLIDAGVVVQTGKVVQAEIASVTGITSPVVVTLREAAGSAIPANTRCLLLQQNAFIAARKQLRFYPLVMSEARHGAPAFNNPANYVVMTGLEPLTGETEVRPFSYADISRRIVSIQLRSNTTQYEKRINHFNTFFHVRSAAAVKSVYLDATKLRPIN